MEAGVRRVVIAVLDPDPRVRGQGVALLEEAGIEVQVGVLADKAETNLLPYLHHRRTGRPLCLLKAAISLDGRTAAADGTSQWITGPAARADAHRLRAESGAVLVGVGTALADNPALTVRDVDPPAPRQPLASCSTAGAGCPPPGRCSTPPWPRPWSSPPPWRRGPQ